LLGAEAPPAWGFGGAVGEADARWKNHAVTGRTQARLIVTSVPPWEDGENAQKRPGGAAHSNFPNPN
jgi:hypothetical protein